MELTNIIAIYAGLVATAVLVLNILRDRPKVIVKAAFGNLKPGSMEVTDIFIRIINNTRRQIHIEEVGFKFYNGDKFCYAPHALHIPEYLQDGDSDIASIEVDKYFKESIGNRIIKYIYVKDATGKPYKFKVPKKFQRLWK